jgi:hypothetical protein
VHQAPVGFQPFFRNALHWLRRKISSREQSMADSEKSENDAPLNGGGSEHGSEERLVHVDAPGISPDEPAEPVEEEEVEWAKAAVMLPVNSESKRENSASPENRRARARNTVVGTALVLAPPPRIRIDPSDAPEARVGEATTPPSSFSRFRAIAATAAIAAVLGGLAGSLATTGINYFVPVHAPPPPPVKSAAVNEVLGRINRELTALKAGVDSSAKATNQQVSKIADRMDRAEKAQTDAGTKLAKASETLDRIERRSSAVSAASTDITGAIGDMNVASAGIASEARQPSSLLTVDGWVLRGVYNGAAMIQGRRVGVIEVVPGDALPELGRIEQIKRQDGRWVVVTSRGLIVSR